MDNGKKKIDINNFSESEFLNWLYLERNREDSIVKTHGWNTWVLIGALLSLLAFLYTKCINTETSIQYKYLVTITSLFISIITSYSWVRYLWERDRGCDVKKLRTLFEQSPMLNNIYMLFVSILYYVLSALMNLDKMLEWLWLICVGLYLCAILNVIFKRRRIVFASTIPSNFIILKHQQIFESITAGVSAMILYRCIQILYKDHPSLCNEFEIAASIVLAGMIAYKLLKLNPIKINPNKRTIDQIIDDVLYNNEYIDNAFNEIKMRRVGFPPMYYIQSELKHIHSLQADVELMCVKLDNAMSLIPNNRPITKKIHKTVNAQAKDAFELLAKIQQVNSSILQKMNDIIAQKYPVLDDEFQIFLERKEKYIVEHHDLLSKVENLVSALNNNVDKYQCKKYGCWCLNTKCTERKFPPSLKDRVQSIVANIKCKLSNAI